MTRVIGLVDLIIVLVVLWLGVHLCLWAHKEYKRGIKK